MKGRTDNARDIWIPAFRVTRSKTAHDHETERDQITWEGTAQLFLEGDLSEFDASEGRIHCSALIPPTPVALSSVSYVPSIDGTISIWEDQERRGIRWKTSLGDAELIDLYDYHHDEKVGLDKALVRIQRCKVTLQPQYDAPPSLKSILCDLSDILDETFWLISFLGRRRVAWYSAEALFIPNERSGKSPRIATARRDRWLGYSFERDQSDTPTWMDVLVNHDALKDGLFQQLLTSYEASQHRNTIRQVIIHLLASHERAYLENQVVNAYTALESLVYGLGEDGVATYLLTSGSFKKLSKKLKQLIRNEIEEEEVAEGVVKKLAELRRRSFLDQLLILIKTYELDIAKLWPPGADIPSELGNLLKRRNLFIHQGRMEDYRSYLFDLNRLQNLIEMWILRLLGCPDEAVNSNARGHLVAIDKA